MIRDGRDDITTKYQELDHSHCVHERTKVNFNILSL